MLLVPLAGEREDAPGPVALRQASAKIVGLLAGDRRGGLHHLLGVVHDAVRAVLGEDDQVHAGQADLHAVDHLGDVAGVVEHLFLGVQARHLVVDDRDADGVVAAGNVAVKHGGRPFWFELPSQEPRSVADHPGPRGRKTLGAAFRLRHQPRGLFAGSSSRSPARARPCTGRLSSARWRCAHWWRGPCACPRACRRSSARSG